MAIGIVCEYNPFHKGHLYHLQTARATYANLYGCTPAAIPIICVMSGHYVQRGEPALLDKWTRTRMALAAGASLVIELPTYYSTATAEWFAYGSISLLHHTGLVDSISFGMEAPEQLPSLQNLCNHLVPESDLFRDRLQHQLTVMPTFASARQAALESLIDAPLALQSPNTILVLEYLKSMSKLNWSPTPLPVMRVSAGYHDLSTEALFPSASAIRRQAANGCSIQSYLPDCCAPYATASQVFTQDLMQSLNYVLCSHSEISLEEIDEVSEGLENRILAAANDSPSYCTLLDRLKTKRYPTSRLRRILLNTLLNITSVRKQELQFFTGPAYIRVLGFRKDQQALLSQLTQNATLPVITNLSRQFAQLPPRAKAMLEDEIRFSKIYSSVHPSLQQDCEFRTPLIVH